MTTEERLAKLEATVDDLRRELERVRTQRRLPMRQTHRCAACGGRRVLNIRLIADQTGGVGSVPLSLAKETNFFGGVRGHQARRRDRDRIRVRTARSSMLGA